MFCPAGSLCPLTVIPLFESFTTDEYEEVKGKIKSGEITVDNSSDDATKPTVSEFTTVNYIQ